jgi:hypothetical protein
MTLLDRVLLARADEQTSSTSWGRGWERDPWDVIPKARFCSCGAKLKPETAGEVCRKCRSARIGVCRMDGCGRRGNSRGYCGKHYKAVFCGEGRDL